MNTNPQIERKSSIVEDQKGEDGRQDRKHLQTQKGVGRKLSHIIQNL
jgi:endonuclease III